MQQENQPIELEDILAEFKKLVDYYRESQLPTVETRGLE